MPAAFTAAMAILTVPTNSELAAFAAAYDRGALESARGIEAGTVNTSYLLELEQGRAFLRIYEEQDFAGAAREASLLVHLAARGIPTPAPLLGRDGLATRPIAGKPAALFPWVEGNILCQRAVTPPAAERVGAALARIHLAGHAPDAPLGGGRFGPAELVARCDRVAASSDMEARALAAPLRETVARTSARRRSDIPRGLIHGDLFRDNVLWDAPPSTCRIAALLDFESAHDGPFVFDLVVTLLSWSYGSELNLPIAAAIVRGYQGVRSLEPNEREALYDEAVFAAVRFTITRITDNAIRVGKRWQRFVERRQAIEALGPRGFPEALGL
jgi:homoserine kinase type II